MSGERRDQNGKGVTEPETDVGRTVLVGSSAGSRERVSDLHRIELTMLADV